MISPLMKHLLEQCLENTFSKRLEAKFGKKKTEKIFNRALEKIENDPWEIVVISRNKKNLEDFLQKTIDEINQEEKK